MDGPVARFCVLARSAEDGADTVLTTSGPLEWPPSGPASVEALNDAVEALGAQLEEAGWIPRTPGEAWYARRFHWVPAGVERVQADADAPAPELFARSPAWPQGAERLWRCEIRWTAGWADSRFEAVARRPRGLRSRAVGVSTPLRSALRGPPEPGTAEGEAALRALVDALEAAGWRPSGRGAAWYAHRFTWPGTGKPPDHVEPASGSAGEPDEPDEPRAEGGSLWLPPPEDQLRVKDGPPRAYESMMSPSHQELERLLRAARPAPRDEFVAELERSLPLERREPVLPLQRREPVRRRRFRLAIGAVTFATGLAAVALLLSVVGLLPFTSGERAAQAGRDCRTVTIQKRESVPVFTRDREGEPAVRYEIKTVPRTVRRCR